MVEEEKQQLIGNKVDEIAVFHVILVLYCNYRWLFPFLL